MIEKIIPIFTAIGVLSAGFIGENEDKSYISVGENDYKLTFSDEFDGDNLDLTKWSYCPEWQRQNIGGYWDDDMTALDGNGNLVLSIGRDENAENRLVSGAIRSKGKFEQAYGYYEIRCTLPPVKGAWSAFWLMGDTVGNVGNEGRDGTEIDIMESPYYPESAINQTLNWDGYDLHHKSKGKKAYAPNLYSGYHTYGLEWLSDEYVYYIDGVETWRTSAGGICENPLYIKVSVEAGTWVNSLDESALPQDMIVDYVRVYANVNNQLI